MKVQFVGAATTVTGSQFLLTTDQARVLVDCGMFQGLPSDVERNRAALPYDPTSLDAVLLTHAHLDHCGYLPVVVREGFDGPVFLTSATADLAMLDPDRQRQDPAGAGPPSRSPQAPPLA